MRMQPVKTYDVIIIGAGPAGIFTALELADKGYSILMVEKGQDIRARIQTSKDPNAASKDKVRNVVCGWGGAGAFSDGKLTLTTEFGGNLDDYMSPRDLMEKIQYVDDVYCRFGGADRKVYGDEHPEKSGILSDGLQRQTCVLFQRVSAIWELMSMGRS